MITVRRAMAVLGLVAALAVPAHGQGALPDTSGFIEVDGARLFFRAVGRGTPLVILHGGPGMSHDYLAPQLVELLADRYKLLFYDQRASGRSTGVSDTTRLTMTQFVQDLEALRRALDLERLNVLGHSFGGLLAMYYAVAHPARVEKLLLLDTAPASWELNFPHFRQTIAARQTDADRREMAEITGAPGGQSDPRSMDRYYKLYFRTFFHDPRLSDSLRLGVDQQWLANIRVTNNRVWGDLGRYDIHDQLERITAPTLILHGESSVISMEGAEAIHARIPNSQLIRLTNVGHFAYIEAPQCVMTAVMAFVW